jgi:hypothetical protein
MLWYVKFYCSKCKKHFLVEFYSSIPDALSCPWGCGDAKQTSDNWEVKRFKQIKGVQSGRTKE